MTVKQYSHKFNQLYKYAPGMMGASRTSMGKFLAGVSSYVVKKYRSAMLNMDMDLSRLIIQLSRLKQTK